MKIYLASRYSRRLELCGYRDELQKAGHQVTSRWLDGSHQISDSGVPIGENGEALVEGGSDSPESFQLRRQFAVEDYADVAAAELVIAFTEPPRSNASRGGRHVELGIAMGLRKYIIVVGYRENIFCWMPDVHFFESWSRCLGFCNILKKG